MITIKQRKELDKIKPPKYREKVQEYLTKKGLNFSLETIQKVYSGKRNNIAITKAIVVIFNNHKKERELINAEINSIINPIDDSNT
ncbi:hypothetical protein TMP248_70037 [Tenacibaculum maritimum]|uniref:hypothetical protein n=1 Tax=Tenacibaculum maritimum TaxID=107401 RepID=UPI0012E56C86|nr:hypothetical protein [Tenacibaculum maritimum]MDB0602407.1 hypothetical protein [Tenacibaculum maritimum]MDB0613432.1 hypothetical protein [Tenacibaculum maritimum]CAA0251219.1 hypothetical protein FS0810_70096 [Tenacibaculum maritimum]CAA0252219.1 hypothetical protein TMP248_70037 [Tenacibaculum maritimum]